MSKKRKIIIQVNSIENLMAESSLYIVSPIIISAFALVVSVLGYVNSNKSLKISEQEHKISEEEHILTKEKEDQKKNLTYLLDLLTATSKTFTELSDSDVFSSMDYLKSDIMQEVYENRTLDLLIKFKYLDVNEKKVSVESVHDEKFLQDELRAFLKHIEETRITVCPHLYYETSPNLPYSERFELIDIFSVLADLRQNLDDLKEFEIFIDSFDSGLLDTIEKEYNEILKLIYKTLSERNFSFKFTSDMKPSDFDKALLDSFNITKIKDKSEFMATDIKNRVDKISKELSMRILTQ